MLTRGRINPTALLPLLETVRGRRGIEGAGRTGRVAARDGGHRFLLHVQTRSENEPQCIRLEDLGTARGYGSPACRSRFRPASDLLQALMSGRCRGQRRGLSA